MAASLLYGSGYLFLLGKGAQNDAHCNCIIPPYASTGKRKRKRNLIVKEKHSFISISLQLQDWKNKDNNFLCRLCFLSLQWNLHTADILYSGHLSTTDFFLRNRWNDAQTLITRPLCSGHFSTVDIIFRSKFILPPRTDFSIVDTSNIRHFLQEMCILLLTMFYSFA